MSEHTHHHEPETSKYEQALKKYDLNLSDEAVKEAVAKIIAEKVPENDTTEVKRFLMGSVELTSLSTTDSEESILRFTERVNAFEDTPTCRMWLPSASIPASHKSSANRSKWRAWKWPACRAVSPPRKP